MTHAAPPVTHKVMPTPAKKPIIKSRFDMVSSNDGNLPGSAPYSPFPASFNV
jgi:hypothetical protein